MIYDSSKNRYFGTVPNSNQAHPTIGYVYASGMVGLDTSGRPTTGILIPAQADSNGALIVNTVQAAPMWQKATATGYVQQMTIPGHVLLQKVQGFSNYTGAENYIQIFDNVGQVGVPAASIISNGKNNFFYDFAQDGTEFMNGVTVATSADAVLTQTGDASMFCTILYRRL